MSFGPAFMLIDLDLTSSIPLYRQLYDALPDAILSGRLGPGVRLPSTRTLASELAISRQTVLGAFDQLAAEGYIEGRVGAGTYVTRSLPDRHFQVDTITSPLTTETRESRLLSCRARALAGGRLAFSRPGETRPFRSGLPALDAFPFDVWTRLTARYWRGPPPELLAYGDPGGYLPLRESIASYLTTARGVRCEAEQVIIAAGAQQGLDLAARLLLDPGDVAWIEDPMHPGVLGALTGAGATVTPVPVDEEGIDIRVGMRNAPRARLAYVTPSHQYPLGVTMSLSRRLELLQWARDAQAWIVEDDYDSEYRYSSRPLASLQGLDAHGRVIYVGTFAKVLFPSIRLGYLVVPPDLVDAFATGNSLIIGHAPSIEQAVVADFIAEGHFARHLRRTRALYSTRRQVLLEAIQERLADRLNVQPSEAGMHLVGWLPPGVDDRLVSQQAAERGVVARALSLHYGEAPPRGGLVLGYAAFGPAEIRGAMARLASAVEASM
jgi:GntR family transcriptional regulator/MocR family aminotransferase